MAARTDPERAPAYWASYLAYSRALAEAGVFAGGTGLEPPSEATSVCIRGAERSVQDGPFIETKELLGGFFLIEVATIDDALLWGSRCPSVTMGGGVELRPTFAPPALV